MELCRDPYDYHDGDCDDGYRYDSYNEIEKTREEGSTLLELYGDPGDDDYHDDNCDDDDDDIDIDDNDNLNDNDY